MHRTLERGARVETRQAAALGALPEVERPGDAQDQPGGEHEGLEGPGPGRHVEAGDRVLGRPDQGQPGQQHDDARPDHEGGGQRADPRRQVRLPEQQGQGDRGGDGRADELLEEGGQTALVGRGQDQLQDPGGQGRGHRDRPAAADEDRHRGGHPDGAEHDMTLRSRRFANQLHGRFSLPVELVDERYSSAVIAQKRGEIIDAKAAAIILQQYFDAH